MAIFSDLPNELISNIWGYVIAPDDVESFALVSKRIYGLSSQFVDEHARLKRQYSIIRFRRLERSYKPADLLEDILLNTRIALYISSLDISMWGVGREKATPQAMALIEDAIRASPFITDSEVEKWITEVEARNEDVSTALIIMQLTKVKRLSLWYLEECDGPRNILRMLELITRSQEAASRPINDQITSTRPSIFSTVSDLKIVRMTFGMVSQFLRYTKNLNSFDYRAHADARVDFSKLCDNLLECSKSSLQKLSICSDNPIPGARPGDITQFPILAEAGVDFATLLGNPDNTCKHLADVLPMSIESVKIFCLWIDVPVEVLRRVILNTIKRKTERLPKLQELSFEFTMRSLEKIERNNELIKELQETSAEVGIALRMTPVQKTLCMYED